MNLKELDTSPGSVYYNKMAGANVRLVFRSNIREPVKVILDDKGDIISETSGCCPKCEDGWEVAEPLKATDIVRDDSTYMDPPEEKVVGP